MLFIDWGIVAQTQNSELWAGLVAAKAMGLTRAIGVSSYNQTHLEALKGEKPVLNQCSMSLKKHDDPTIDYCLKHNITYEAFGVMRGCPFTDPHVAGIAKAHKVSAAQVCVRWTLQRGAIAALGTGDDSSKVREYTEENLGVWTFKLSSAEMAILDGLQDKYS